LGLDPGDLKDQVIPHEALGTVFTAMGKKETAPKAYQHAGFTDKGEPLSFDPETGNYEVGPRIPGMENKTKDPNAPKPLTKAQIIRLNSDKTRGLAAAEKQFKKDVKEAVDAQGRQEAEDDLTKAKQAVQDAYEQGIEAATGAPQQHLEVSGAGKAPAATQTAPAATTAPAAPAKGTPPAAAAPNVANMERVRAFAKKYNMSEADAIRAAKKEGFTISGQK